MKLFKKVVVVLLTVAMLVPAFSSIIIADGVSESVITNGYIIYRYNEETGGFSIETAEGHPKKESDDNMPLLYEEDNDRSNGTSFITVRIDGKDYIFGQDYGFFGFNTNVGKPVISEEGRLMTISWTVKGITVTKKIALTKDSGSDTLGNAGLSFEVVNNSGKSASVGIRLLLDTALGSKTDAPYMIVDKDLSPTYVETEFSGDFIPSQIRNVDALVNPTAVSYIMPVGVSSLAAKPSRVIIGHWANLANTRYDYTADKYCDFTSYSNLHKIPDGAAALYWEEPELSNGKVLLAEMLYGVGNIAATEGSDFCGLNIAADRVELNGTGDAYSDGGEITVDVELRNDLDASSDLSSVVLMLTAEENDFELLDSLNHVEYTKINKGAIKHVQFRLRAKPQYTITSGQIYVSLTGTRTTANGEETVETMAVKNVILPSVKTKYHKIKINEVRPGIVWTGGEKAVTLTGIMTEFAALTSDGWDLRLNHTASGQSVLIEKKNISFIGNDYKNMSFTTNEELTVGAYDIVFSFTDPTLIDTFGKSITVGTKLEVSSDKKYALRSYGIIALIRSTIGNDTNYDFFTFESEGQYSQFYDGKLEKTGALHGASIKYDFGLDVEAINKYEILLTVRGDLREMEKTTDDGKKEKYWQADYADGDIIINNILSYEGDKPIELFEENKQYKVKGDGLLKVVNSVNVWRSKWSFNVTDDLVSTLDPARLTLPDKGSRLRLSLDGAAVMMQSLSGFLIDMKYGEMYSTWYDDSDGRVTYGIGFGGQISLPIKEERSAVRTPGTGSGTSGSGSSHGNKPTGMTDGQLTAAVNNVLFGEEAHVKDSKVVIDGIGYVGIDTTVAFGLPRDLLGSLISNAPGLSVSMRINTIDNIYEFSAGVNIRIIECEAVLAFKEVRVRNRDVIVPDKVEFYIHEGLQIPVAPPVLFITGLGGGINGLADTIGGSFTALPPITLILSTRLKAISLLEGAFKARISLEGLSLEGALTINGLEKYLNIEAGISARWADPWSLNLYGNINLIDGVIKGGLSVTLANNYFYGYLFADFCIPDSVPLIGGMQLGGIEAAVSDKFIGANIKVLGFKYGVIYYWGGDVNFEKNLDISAPPSGIGIGSAPPYMLRSDTSDTTAYYGINIGMLETVSGSSDVLLMANSLYSYVNTTVYRAESQHAILLEIPYTGSGIPSAGDFYLENPDGKRVDLTAADDEGNGSFLVQDRGGDGKFIYISIMENGNSIMKSGNWRINYCTENITLGNIKAYGIDEIPELKPNSVNVSYSPDTSPFDAEVSWDVTAASGKTGEINVYLTDDPDVLENLRGTNSDGSSLGINILHMENVPANRGNASFTIPDALDSGTYYTVVTFSTSEGISCEMTDTPFIFINPKLPADVTGVRAEYIGNGNYHVVVTDAENYDYTHYMVEIADTDGTVLENNVNLFSAGDKNMVIGKEAGLVAGKKYIISVRTLREEIIPATTSQPETAKRYYGDNIISSAEFTMPEIKKPVLTDVRVSFDTGKEYISTDRVVIEYTFAEPAYVELSLRGQTMTLSDEYKKDWRFELDGLEDGDYVIDFTAFSPSGDSVTGNDFIAVLPDGQLGFSVDTSAPVLSLAQTRTQSLDADGSYATIGKNTVLTDYNGSYIISGMTESTAVLTIDGVTTGIERGKDGEFVYTGTLDSGMSSLTHTIKAVDAAGNISVLTVYVINIASTELTGIKLKSNGVELNKNEYGEYVLDFEYGEELSICAVGITSSGSEIEFSDDRIGWDIMYGNNLISLNKGETIPANTAVITAAGAGETAVKASLSLTDVETDSRRISTSLDAYVIIKLTKSGSETYRVKTPEPVTVNGITAEASVIPATGIEAGTLVRVIISLSGNASQTGKHVIGLTSASEVSGITAPTYPEFSVTEGDSVSTGLTFSFIMPEHNVDTLTINKLIVLPPGQIQLINN